MFATPSTMKPTQIQCSEGAVNQIPAWTEVKGQIMYYIMTTDEYSIKGDIRLTPFYDIDECMARIMGLVEELNKGLVFSTS